MKWLLEMPQHCLNLWGKLTGLCPEIYFLIYSCLCQLAFPVPLAVPARPADEERLPPRDAVLDEVVLFPVFAAMNEFYASSKINPADAPRISEVKIIFL